MFGEEYTRNKVASRAVTPPTMTAADTRAEQHPEARHFRYRRTVAKLKKTLEDEVDLSQLDEVRVLVNQLPD